MRNHEREFAKLQQDSTEKDIKFMSPEKDRHDLYIDKEFKIS